MEEMRERRDGRDTGEERGRNAEMRDGRDAEMLCVAAADFMCCLYVEKG